MMVLRVVLALAFLGITSWFQLKDYTFAQVNYYPLYAIVVIVSVLTIIYASVVSLVGNLRLFTYVQVALDIALVTVIVYVTGGIESYLTILYLLSVIGSSIVLSRRGGYFAASLSSILYGVMVDLDFYGVLPLKYKIFWNPPQPLWKDVLTTVSANILAFFTVAYLTGYLAEKTAKAEKELEEKGVDYDKLERLNRHIVENISSGIMTLDERSRITSFNRAAENITGYLLRDVYNRNVDDLFHGLLPQDEDAPLYDIRLEKNFTRKDATEVYLGFTVSCVEGGGDASMIIIFQDLTRLAEMEEQLRRAEKLNALGELSVGIAHEIRNPLASISGSIQVLKNDLKLPGEDVRLMEIVLSETERLNALITDFLVFARPAQEKRMQVDVGAVINETLKMFRNSNEAAGVRIENLLDCEIFVDGDARQLGQVFWNLFVNAAHAMESRGTLTVSCAYRHGESPYSGRVPRQGPAESSYAEIRVADTGCGIAPQDIARVFDPFFSTKCTGTGLGLAIAHRIVESHGGAIDVKSRQGEGTVFTVVLPLAQLKA